MATSGIKQVSGWQFQGKLLNIAHIPHSLLTMFQFRNDIYQGPGVTDIAGEYNVG